MKKPEAFEEKRRNRDKQMKRLYKRRTDLLLYLIGALLIGGLAGATVLMPLAPSFVPYGAMVGGVLALWLMGRRMIEEI